MENNIITLLSTEIFTCRCFFSHKMDPFHKYMIFSRENHLPCGVYLFSTDPSANETDHFLFDVRLIQEVDPEQKHKVFGYFSADLLADFAVLNDNRLYFQKRDYVYLPRTSVSYDLFGGE